MSDSSAYQTSKADKTYLDKAYALQSPSEAKTLYDEWAKTYDADLSDLEYVFHRHAADAVLKNLSHKTAGDGKTKATVRVFDAGCGTGLVGVALNEVIKSGNTRDGHEMSGIEFEITGVDISSGMLDVARKTELYTTLEEVDLTEPLGHSDGMYDVVVCVGTLTRGHVGPGVLSEFARVAKSGGLVVATVLEEIWEAKGVDKAIERLSEEEAGKAVEVVSNERVGVVKGSEEGGRLVVLRKT